MVIVPRRHPSKPWAASARERCNPAAEGGYHSEGGRPSGRIQYFTDWTGMETLEIQRVRGTNDFVPPDDARLRRLTETLRTTFSLYGYQGIETPIIEDLDLFLRKSGEEIVARMYAFTHWNRKLCLRPELTASVMRAYVNHLQDKPLPVRVHYAGPTFRYEKPQRGRYRQFTQVGVECIGGAGSSADAEVLAIGCGSLEAIGLSSYRLVLGHLGAVLQLLEQLGIDEHGQALI